MLEVFIQAFVLYFVVIDPIGNTPLFMSITQNQSGKDKIRTAVEGIVIATVVLILFSIIGQFILSYLNISLESFRIAGGIILFLIALEMLFNKRQERKERILDLNKDKISIFPLAIPILAGPAAITSVIVIATKYQSDFKLHLISILGLIGVMIITLLLFILLAKSDKFINRNITNIISRVIAIILAALSIQYIVDGLLILFNS
jgi:multiple antibiotic resistance protein